MKHTNNIRMMMLACGLSAVASCSDFDDFNTVPSAVDPAADKTLWENIASNLNLREFKAVLERVGYDKVLDAAHTYTVWAPVDGSFNSDSLAQVSDEKVVKEFLNNMIADYAHHETTLHDTVIYMLNEKLLKFANKGTAGLTFDAQRILPNVTNPSVYNYPSTNGLLYVVSNPSVFRYNGYEYIGEMAGLASYFNQYVKHYEHVTLDEANSVKGEIIEGVQHYDDSVTIVHNTWMTDMTYSQIDNEDSLYTVLIPTDEAWEEAYNRIASYFNYIETINWQDLESNEVGTDKGATVKKNANSLMKAEVGKTTASLEAAPANALIQEVAAYWNDSITNRFLTDNLIFSETDKRYNKKLVSGTAFTKKDTLRSTTYSYLTNLQELDAVTQEVVTLSNGHARIINKLPFLSEETYAPIIRTRDVAREVSSVNTHYSIYTWQGDTLPFNVVLDDKDETFGWVETEAENTFAPELDFYLHGVLSTTYDVFVVVVPNSMKSEDERLPYSLFIDINYTDADNKQIAGRFDGETLQVGTANVKKVEPFEVGQYKVDTIRAGRVTFPICYAGTEAKPNIKVTHSVSTFLSTQKKLYEQNLRIANVILKPVKEEE